MHVIAIRKEKGKFNKAKTVKQFPEAFFFLYSVSAIFLFLTGEASVTLLDS